MGKSMESSKNWKNPGIMWNRLSSKAQKLLDLIKKKSARNKKNDESTLTKNKSVLNKKNCEPTPMPAPGLTKNKKTCNKKNEESAPMQDLPGLIKKRSAPNRKNEGSKPTGEIPGLIKNKGAWNKKNDECLPILPPEIIIEILSWLPLKYLSRVQLVCKEWQAVVHEHYFTEKHMSRSSVVHHWYNVVRNVTRTYLNSHGQTSFRYIHGCDGLVLVQNNLSHKYFIWNPAISRVLELPDPHDGSYGLALSFVRATRNYRVVSMYKDKESGVEGCEVLTPGQSKTWRPLAFPDAVNENRHTQKEKVLVVSTGGAVHCVRITKIGEKTAREILTLDLETECFTVNHLPSGVFRDRKTVWELDWDGKLAFVAIVRQNLQWMELEDYKKHRWCENEKIIPLTFLKDIDLKGNVIPLFTRQGEIWFWLKDKKIFAYTIKSGKVTDTWPSESFALEHKLYCYKPSLVAFEGMQPATNLKRIRPHFMLD